jgi:hypothetical protein
MERLENELRRGLSPRDPSPDFTARVMARLRSEHRAQRPPLFRWALAGAVAALLLVSAGLQQRHARLQRQRAEAACEQLILSLEIASSKLNKAREAVLQISEENSI